MGRQLLNESDTKVTPDFCCLPDPRRTVRQVLARKQLSPLEIDTNHRNLNCCRMIISILIDR